MATEPLSFEKLRYLYQDFGPDRLDEGLAVWEKQEIVLRGFVIDGENGEKILSPLPQSISNVDHVVLNDWPGTSKDRPVTVRGRFSVELKESEGQLIHCYRLDDCRLSMSRASAAGLFVLLSVLVVAVAYYVSYLRKRFSQKAVT